MTTEEYKKAADFWNTKECKGIPVKQLKAVIEEFLNSSTACALVIGTGDYVRCTPLEYGYHDGLFRIFTEGGKKFIGLEKNRNVSLAVFEKNPDFGELKSIQVMGTAKLIKPSACADKTVI